MNVKIRKNKRINENDKKYYAQKFDKTCVMLQFLKGISISYRTN